MNMDASYGRKWQRTVTLWRLWIQNTTLRVQEISALMQTGHIDISAGESGQLGTGAKMSTPLLHWCRAGCTVWR